MKYVRKKVVDDYIAENCPNARMLRYDDPECGFKFYTSDELQEVDENWFPLCSYKNSSTDKVVYGGKSGVMHTYLEAPTGGGKTTGPVMQSIRALSSMKVKPSFLISDMHGEIIENLYLHLMENGYNIRILNCDNASKSDTYNPFALIAKECADAGEITSNAVLRARSVAEVIQPIEAEKDPIWDMGARSYTNGCILDMLEDIVAGVMPWESLTIYNLIQRHYWLRTEITKGYNGILGLPHYKAKGMGALSVQKLVAVTDNAERTRASYFGVVENHYDLYGNPSMYKISSSNTIDIAEFINEPTVIVVQSGTTNIGDALISLLVNDIYTEVVKEGKTYKTKKLPRDIHCFLDEFANCNIADGETFIKMLTTSRKFGMHWHMILQCDAQLDKKYSDPRIGQIIRSNCTEMYMGSFDYATQLRFAESCGLKTVETLETLIRQDVIPTLTSIPLITPEKLNSTVKGQLFIKIVNHPLIDSYHEPFYNCPEFMSVESLDDIYPTNNFNYKSTAFTPMDIPSPVSYDEYDVLVAIGEGGTTIKRLNAKLERSDLDELISLLQRRKMVATSGNKIIRLLSEPQMKVLKNLCQSEVPTVKDNAAKRRSSKNPFEDYSDYDDADTGFTETVDLNKYLENIPDDEPEENTDAKSDNNGSIAINDDYIDIPYEVGRHIRENRDTIDPDAPGSSKIVPDYLNDVFESEYYCASLDVDTSKIIDNKNMLKYEIIEMFISKHSFQTKDEWVNEMKRLMEELAASNAFPKIIMDVFEATLNEFINELTIENILEIKRILNGETE